MSISLSLSLKCFDGNQAPTTGMTRGYCRSATDDQVDAIVRCNKKRNFREWMDNVVNHCYQHSLSFAKSNS